VVALDVCTGRTVSEKQFSGELSPAWHKAGLLGMALIEQDQELRCSHRMQWCAWIHRPPQQFAGGETAQAQPKSVSVIDQELQRGRRTVTENVQGTRKRVLLPLVTTQGREGVHPFAEIDGGDCQQNPQLGHELAA
jgi:hypothetical protein